MHFSPFFKCKGRMPLAKAQQGPMLTIGSADSGDSLITLQPQP